MRVRIPFNPRFAPWMLEGVKVCTARTQRLGRPGDFFHAFGAQFEITYIDHFPLGPVANRLYRHEGFRSPNEFIDFWRQIHPLRGYQPNMMIYLHWFLLFDLTVAGAVTARNWCPYCPHDRKPDPESVCEHFIGYAGQVEPHPDNIGVRTPVSVRIYRNGRGRNHEF